MIIFLKYSTIIKIRLLFNLFVQKTPWFSIGSVDAFERNLEAAQTEAGIDTNSHMPVIYKSEIES
jgi:AFG3 family protein